MGGANAQLQISYRQNHPDILITFTVKHPLIIASVAEFDQSGPAGHAAPAWRDLTRLYVNFIKFMLRYKNKP
jgi:hypothetical protein